MVIAAHAKRESRHAISRAKSENFSGFQIYKISITLPICIATESVSQSFYKYSFFLAIYKVSEVKERFLFR